MVGQRALEDDVVARQRALDEAQGRLRSLPVAAPLGAVFIVPAGVWGGFVPAVVAAGVYLVVMFGLLLRLRRARDSAQHALLDAEDALGRGRGGAP